MPPTNPPTPRAGCASCGKPLSKNYYAPDDWYCAMDGCAMQYKQQPVPPASAPAATPLAPLGSNGFACCGGVTGHNAWCGQRPAATPEPERFAATNESLAAHEWRYDQMLTPEMREKIARPARPTGEEAETPTRIEPCHHCEHGNAVEICETVTAQWGTECPPVEIEDTLWRCQSCGAAWYDAKQSQRHTRALLRATIGAQATALAALRARVERIEWAEKLCISVHHNFIPGDEAITATYHDVIRGEDVSANGPTWDAALAALRAALAPRQLTGDQP